MEEAKRLKNKIGKGEPVFGCWTSFGHLGIAEIFAESGVDFLGIDIEHSTISLDDCRAIILASHKSGIACLPRIASHNMEMIKRLLDAGADGIICPMVSSAEEVADLVEWVKYPPVGRRSFGIATAQRYGFGFDDYVKEWNDASTLVIQIESREGVEAIEEMVAFDEVDAVMIGPYDLSGSLGVPGQLEHPTVLAACERVREVCSARGKPCATHLPKPAVGEGLVAATLEKYPIVIFSSDVFVLWRWSEQLREALSPWR